MRPLLKFKRAQSSASKNQRFQRERNFYFGDISNHRLFCLQGKITISGDFPNNTMYFMENTSFG